MFDYLKSNKMILIIVIILVMIVLKNVFINNFEKINLNELDNSNYQTEGDDLETASDSIYVDIKGSIKLPGVYEMNEGDRVVDVVEKAGGMTHENSQCVNLSEKISDEQVIVIPEKDTMCETVENSTQENKNNDNKININTANVDELVTLNGIGDKRANDIVKYREQHGHFSNIEDLKNVSGIGDSTFDNLKDDIVV